MLSTELHGDFVAGRATMSAELIGRIRTRLKALRISEREAARRAGIGLSYVGDLVHGRVYAPTLPKLESLSEALECDLEYLMGRQNDPRLLRDRSFQPTGESAAGALRFIDLYGSPNLSQESWVSVSAGAVDKVQVIPPLLNVPDAYAWSIANRLMEPRYFPGEVAYINPSLRATEGDFVFIRRSDGLATVARLKTIDDDSVTLCYLRTRADGTPMYPDDEVRMDQIETIHRIVGSAG